MVRVLKPEGRIATAVWNAPDKNFRVMSIMSIIHRFLELPLPPPDSPGMFRCAKDGFISELFSKAGLKNISEKEVVGKLNLSEGAEKLWSLFEMERTGGEPDVVEFDNLTSEYTRGCYLLRPSI